MKEHKISCPRCDGDGEIREDSPIPDTCPRCSGTGKINLVTTECNPIETKQVKPRAGLRIKPIHIDYGIPGESVVETKYQVILEFNGCGVGSAEPGRPFNYAAIMGSKPTVDHARELASQVQRSMFPIFLDGVGAIGEFDPQGREGQEQVIKRLERLTSSLTKYLEAAAKKCPKYKNAHWEGCYFSPAMQEANAKSWTVCACMDCLLQTEHAEFKKVLRG